MTEAATEPMATRQAYGAALVDLGEALEEVVALDADRVGEQQPIKLGRRVAGRFCNCGAAEANMM